MGDEGGRAELLVQQPAGIVVDAQTPFAVNHTALGFDHLGLQREVRNPVGFHVEHQLQRRLRKEVRVNRNVVRGIGVVVPAGLLHFDVELLGPVLL